MNRVSANRLEHIDIARGIGIIIIVFAHNYLSKGNLFALSVSSSFNMPLFYLLSGVFFKASEPLAVVTNKRYSSLLVPYFFTLLTAALTRFVAQDNLSFPFL